MTKRIADDDEPDPRAASRPRTSLLPLPRNRDADLDATPEAPLTVVAQHQTRAHNARNISMEMLIEIKDTRELAQIRRAFDRRYLRPLSPSVVKQRKYARKMWLQFFTFLFESAEKAQETLLPGAPAPRMEYVKCLVKFVATGARSGLGIKGVKGMNMRSAIRFVDSTIAMRQEAQCANFTPDEVKELHRAVEYWAKIEKTLTTKRKEKRVVLEEDLEELLRELFNPSLGLKTRLMQLQMAALVCFIYTHGTRPGSVVVNNDYRNSYMQFLAWGDLEIILRRDGTGILIEMFVKIRCNKGQRTDDSLYTQTSMRSLSRSKAHMDASLMIVALGVIADVFQQDALDVFANPAGLSEAPFRLNYKPGAGLRPVFVDEKDRSKPMSYGQATYRLNLLGKSLNLSGLRWYAFRYGFATCMAQSVPEHHLAYLMGHNMGSRHGTITYRSDTGLTDNAGAMYEGVENASEAMAFHRQSSVSWNRPNLPESSPRLNDVLLLLLIQQIKDNRVLLRQQFGDHADPASLWADGNDETVVQEAVELQARVFERYLSLATADRALPPGLPALTTNDQSQRQSNKGLFVDQLLEIVESRDTNPLAAIASGASDNFRHASLLCAINDQMYVLG
ncbi:hypothetical protein MKEN_00412000 [Mycena kentingensis (nom. inval.)]|nr:hypothetical protein MKEN_00412000 [Mycena kentingensis (nom. inval.)]